MPCLFTRFAGKTTLINHILTGERGDAATGARPGCCATPRLVSMAYWDHVDAWACCAVLQQINAHSAMPGEAPLSPPSPTTWLPPYLPRAGEHGKKVAVIENEYGGECGSWLWLLGWGRAGS